MPVRRFKMGSFYRVDDRSGFTIRSEESRREWNGQIVHENAWEPRHPQDFVGSGRDEQTVPDPRPEPTPGILGPLQTTLAEAAAAGATTLTVDLSTRFGTGDTVWVLCGVDDGAIVHRTTLADVPDSETLVLVTGLPKAAALGSLVSNMTVVAAVTPSML